MDYKDSTYLIQGPVNFVDQPGPFEELLEIVRHGTKQILSSIVIALVITVAYLFFTPKWYQANSYVSLVSPSVISDVTAVGVVQQEIGFTKTPKALFDRFVLLVQRRSLLQKWFTVQSLSNLPEYIGKSEQKAFSEFYKNIFFDVSGTDTIKISLKMQSQQKVARQLNFFVAMVADIVAREMRDEYRYAVFGAQKRLHELLTILTEKAQQQKKQELQRLQEAYDIAREENIARLNIKSSTVVTENNLFLLGQAVLQKKISWLKNAENSYFIPEIKELQQKLNLLVRVPPIPESFKAVYIDQKALTPEKAVSPRKKLVLFSALIFGFMVGFLWAIGSVKTNDKA